MTEMSEPEKVAMIERFGFDKRPTVEEALLRAAEIVIRTQFGSTSMLQLKLGLGFANATETMSELERHGIVGEQRSARSRDVLVAPEDADDVLAAIAYSQLRVSDV